MNSHSLKILPLVLFALIVLSFYRGGVGYTYLAFGDHKSFMRQREFSSSDLDYFWKMTSFNRTRQTLQGDYLAFRPLFGGYSALMDITFREKLLGWWASALILHTLVSYAMYYVLARILTPLWALGFTFSFALLWPGSLMVQNRHINPYMGSLFFMNLALGRWLRLPEKHSSREEWLIGALFFFGGCFHESIPYFSLLCLLCPKLLGTFRSRIRMFGFPAMAYLLLNIADWFYRGSPPLFGPADRVENLSHLYQGFSLFFGALSKHVLSYLLPQSGSYFPALSSLLPELGFAIAGLMVFYGIWVQKTYPVPTRWITFYLLFVLALLTFGRGLMRGSQYLEFAEWYFYFSRTTLTLVAALLFSQLKNILPARTQGALIAMALALLGNHIVHGHQKRTHVYGTQYEADWTKANRLASITDSIGEGQCFLRCASQEACVQYPPVFFYRKSCRLRPGKEALELQIREGGTAYLTQNSNWMN